MDDNQNVGGQLDSWILGGVLIGEQKLQLDQSDVKYVEQNQGDGGRQPDRPLGDGSDCPRLLHLTRKTGFVRRLQSVGDQGSEGDE